MNVLITGIASGIGKAIKDQFIKNKITVYGLDVIEVEKEDYLVPFKCDITSREDIENIAKELKENKIELDLIINVAGIHKMASLVETDFSILKKVIDINLTGTMLVNNIFHSLLKNKGRIILVTSEVASYDPLPFNGLYNISKNALESYAQGLRQELNLLNQQVITIQPGAVETPLSASSLVGTSDLVSSTVLYKKQAKHFLHLVKNFMGTPIKSEKLGKLVYKISLKKRVKYTYKIHRSPGLVLLSILPKRLQCLIIKTLLNR